MTFFNLISDLQTDTLRSLALFAPELILCVTIVILLLARMIIGRGLSASLIALIGSLAAFGCAAGDGYLVCCGGAENLAKVFPEGTHQVQIFTGMLVFNAFTVYFRTFLLAFTCLFVFFTWRSGIPDREDGPDFYTLALGAIIGMCLMVSANHLLMVFLAVEMASVPSYALAGMLKGRRQSSEAALKFAIYGAGAAGVMLYGISLLSGAVGSLRFPEVAIGLANLLMDNPQPSVLMALALGGLMVMVGLAFKLSAVPFHFWAPDVFEGAAAEIGGFLSVASKAAALALLVRLAVGFTHVPEESPTAEKQPAPAKTETAQTQTAQTQTAPAAPRFYIALQNQAGGIEAPPEDSSTSASAAPAPEASHPKQAPAGDPLAEPGASDFPQPTAAQANAALAPVRYFISSLVALLAAITATWGNLAAYGQTNIKRLLAYSTIAHAGYMMMPVAAAMALSGEDAASALAAVAFYVVMYLFMNLGAFAVVAFVRNQIRSEEIADYAGLIKESPGLAICFGVIMMSLLGLPPLAGFAAKFAVFGSLADARLWTLFVIAGANTAVSVFYYLRVLKVMALEEAPANRPPIHTPVFASVNGLFVFVLTLPLIGLGVFWGPVHQWALEAARYLLS